MILKRKSIMTTCPQLCGRLGNYLFNIAFCTSILHKINIKLEYKRYLYLNCAGLAYDGHQNEDIFHYRGETTDSFYLSLFKYDLIDKDDNIYSITCTPNELELEYKCDKIKKHIFSRNRLLYAIDCDDYRIIYDNFPIIIEVFKKNNIIVIQLNNMLYEGVNDMIDFTKNIYLDNDDIMPKLSQSINKIIDEFDADYFFIKMDFAIISSHLTFHSMEFNKYFRKKLFSYKIKDINVLEYVQNKYNIIKSKYSDDIFVSVHFRGSDYGDPKKQTEWFAVLGGQYYIDSINHIRERNINKRIKFVFFSLPEDENFIENILIIHIKKHINNPLNSYILYREFINEYTELFSPQLNLCFMGLFDYMCLSNSTYSWWSHYLSPLFHKQGHYIYVPLLYQFPQNQQQFDSVLCNFEFEDNNLMLNNYIVNVLIWYGYRSSIYVYMLFKRFIESLSDKISKINIDRNIFIEYIDNILRILKLKKLINDEDINIKDELLNVLDDKQKIKIIIKKAINKIFNDRDKIYSLEKYDNHDIYICIAIKEILETPDRARNEIYENYHNISLEKSTINITTIK